MVICLIAAVVFGFMAIFSARYRGYAREAFHCVFRMATLRKCDTEFDKKLRAAIVGKLMKWPRFAGFVYRRFEIISWVFVIVFFVSLAYTGYSIYNLIVWQNCEGPGGSCVFVPQDSGTNVTICAYGNVPTAPPEYFDNNASVMFFYQDGCPWCAKEMTVLERLAKDGYRVKPMHLDTNPEYWTEYNIQVTPTFIGPDGARLNGYHDTDALKGFLDNYR
ncbi:MAG: thioredoxin family protein [Candidatus Aenigmatarchaeota archaeon]